jgi:ABC-type phosphate transport system substrate-binding protein
MPWWNRERRIRGLALLGVFGLAGGLALTGTTTPDTQQIRGVTNSRQSRPVDTPSVKQPLDTTGLAAMSKESQNSGSLVVNGQSVPLPANGSVQKTITTDNGATSIDYSAHHSTSGSSNQSNVNINIQSSSHNSSTAVHRTATSSLP